MRKMLLSLAAAASAAAIATPAAAQWYPAPSYGAPYGYGGGYGYNGYGYGYGYGAIQARVQQVRSEIAMFANRGQISPWNAARLMDDTRSIEWSLRSGNPYQLRNAEVRLNIIEQRLRYSGNGYGYRPYRPY